MQEINDIVDAKLVEYYKSQKKRNYLGASSVGDECLRKVQLQYMGKEPKISARQLRTFDIGHYLEDLVIQWLRIAGFHVTTRNEKGEQYEFSVADGKLKGHVDGIIQGFPKELPTGAKSLHSAPGSWLLEIKTMCNKNWNDTKKRGALVSKPIYYCQVQLYMAYMVFEKCLFVALNKDTSELYFELIPFDSEVAQMYSDRAVQVIKASENNEQMPCISSDPSFFKCKMCSFRNECRKNEIQETLK